MYRWPLNLIFFQTRIWKWLPVLLWHTQYHSKLMIAFQSACLPQVHSTVRYTHLIFDHTVKEVFPWVHIRTHTPILWPDQSFIYTTLKIGKKKKEEEEKRGKGGVALCPWTVYYILSDLVYTLLSFIPLILFPYERRLHLVTVRQ